MLAAALVVAGPVPRTEGPFGSGAQSVWIIRPAGEIRSIVVFGHGWKAAPPSSEAPWVRQFGPWLAHLLSRGSAIVFPRYQLGGEDPSAAQVDAFRRGVALGLARLHADVPIVAVGYSLGATLSVYYGADAARWGLPPPKAVDAIFPAGLLAGAPLDRIGRDVSVLVQVGDEDTAAGRPGAAPIWSWLATHAKRRYDLVRSHGAFLAVHSAPKETTAAAQRVFWAPLDALIATATR
jgi:acetyl esterase/lipase